MLHTAAQKVQIFAAGPIYRVLAQTDAETFKQVAAGRCPPTATASGPLTPDSPAAQMRGKQWENSGRQTELSMEESGRRAGQDTAAQALQAQVQAGRRRTYRDFLRRFAVWHEEPHLDPEEFDLGFYSYGLRTYGNLPLMSRWKAAR